MSARRCAHCAAPVDQRDIAATGYYRCPTCWILTTPNRVCDKCGEWADGDDECPSGCDADGEC